MNPPTGVRVSAVLMFLSIVAGLAVAFTQPAPPMPANLPAGLVGAIKILVLVLAVIEAVIVYFYMKGANWAKWFVIVASVWYIVQLVGLPKALRISHISAGLMVANAILSLFLLVYLFSNEATAYFSPGSAAV